MEKKYNLIVSNNLNEYNRKYMEIISRSINSTEYYKVILIK